MFRCRDGCLSVCLGRHRRRRRRLDARVIVTGSSVTGVRTSHSTRRSSVLSGFPPPDVSTWRVNTLSWRKAVAVTAGSVVTAVAIATVTATTAIATATATTAIATAAVASTATTAAAIAGRTTAVVSRTASTIIS